MRVIRWIRPLLGVGLVTIVSACGDDTGPSFAGNVDSATVHAAADNAKGLLSRTLDLGFEQQWIGAPYPGFLARGIQRRDATTLGLELMERARLLTDPGAGSAGAPAFATAPLPIPAEGVALTCNPTFTGVDSLGFAIDEDGDFIPDDFTVNYGANCAESVSGGIYSFSGSYRIQDTDSGFASYRYTATHFKAKLQDGSSPSYFSREVNGSETASFFAAHAAHGMNFSVLNTARSGGTTISVEFKALEHSTFTATSGNLAVAAPLPPGAFDFNSEFQMLGTKSGGEIPGDYKFLFSTPTELAYDPACGSGLTAGTFLGLLNGKETIGFQAVWSGCGDPTFTYFGISE